MKKHETIEELRAENALLRAEQSILKEHLNVKEEIHDVVEALRRSLSVAELGLWNANKKLLARLLP